ncbi:GNAT family N-acetyltransferase [Maritalea sp.]|uniref:GNAT family N-acetyltransferase n=1 Tax=Maritalea sp. TaxID=2003361 RepID=UPI003EF80854
MANPQTKIRPMRQSEFDIWLPHCTNEFAKEKAQVLEIADDQALKLSQESFERSFPNGLASPGNNLFSILDDADQVIGTIWFVVSTKWGATTAFIYDLEIQPDHRRQGHAKAAMSLIEPEAKKLGATKLALHVFGFNHGAANLYKKLGYKTTDISMAKPL